MIVVIRNFDGHPPPEGASEPMRVALVRRLASSDGAQYWLARPPAAFAFSSRNGRSHHVSYVIVSPGWLGQSFEPGFDGRVNLAYVTDNSQVSDEAIDFEKGEYVAYGDGFVVPGAVA
jgi:hypothetical protein